MSVCRSCGAEIVWALTDAGRRIPIDAEPVADGTIVLVDGYVKMIGKSETEVRYKTHYATCPQASEWRKR